MMLDLAIWGSSRPPLRPTPPLLLLLLLLLPLVTSQGAEGKVGQLRLVDGAGPHEGNIQVEVNGVWGYVCDDDFGFREADVVCRDLGYTRADTFTRNNHFGNNSPAWRRSKVRFWLDRVNCSSAAAFRDCSSSGLGVHDCGPTEIAGVVCSRSETRCGAEEFSCGAGGPCIKREAVCDGVNDCFDRSDERQDLCLDVGVARISSNTNTNIPGAAYGTVLVKFQQEWSTICSDSFTPEDAKVICRSLGYRSGWVVPFPLSYFGPGTGPIRVSTMECRGTEDWIWHCPSFEWSSPFCSHTRDAGVFCYDGGLELRLARGPTPDTGLLEAKMGDVWAGFCDSDFDDFDAKVACRMLGYRDGVTAMASRSSSPAPLWQLRLDCLGHESNLQECRIRFLNNTCSRTSAANIRCSNTAGEVDAALKALLPGDCGVLEEASDQFLTRLAKVRGGLRSTRFNSPWLASLRTSKGGLGCGATIISEDYLISAAHCFRLRGKLNFRIRVGDHNDNFEEEFEEEFDIENIWIHENFNAYAFLDNDIALIKISRNSGRGIRFGARVKPICLPKTSDSYENLGNCIVMGWGKALPDGELEPRPNEAVMRVVPDNECEGFFLGGAHNYTSSNVCLKGTKLRVVACQGDSGGPISCSPTGRHTLYGIVSRGPSCGSIIAPEIDTRITKYIHWILEKIRN